MVSRRFSSIVGGYTQMAAVNDAISRGGHLAVIASEAERLEAAAQAAFTGAPLWVGYSDRSIEGTFRTVTGENGAMITFQTGAPNDGVTYNIGWVGISRGPSEDGVSATSFGLTSWNDEVETAARGYVLETERWAKISALYEEAQGSVGVGFVRQADLLATPLSIPGNPIRLTSASPMPANLLGFDIVTGWTIEWSLVGQNGATVPGGHVLSAETQFGSGYEVSGNAIVYGGRSIASLDGQNSTKLTVTMLALSEGAHLQALQNLPVLKYPGQNPSSLTVVRTVKSPAAATFQSKPSTWAISENDSPVIGAIAPQKVTLAAGTWAPTPPAPFDIALNITDEEGNVQGLSVSVVSGVTSVIPAANAIFKDGGWVIRIPEVRPDEDGTALVPLTLTVTDSGGAQSIKTLNVDIQAGPKIVTLPVGGDVRLGGPMTLSVVATGTGPLTYE